MHKYVYVSKASPLTQQKVDLKWEQMGTLQARQIRLVVACNKTQHAQDWDSDVLHLSHQDTLLFNKKSSKYE